MIYLVLALSIGIMASIAVWAYRKLAPGLDQLPMQWSVGGNVNWRAPRLVAIAATPLLILSLMALIFVISRQDHGERDMALLWVALIGPALQALHMALVARTVKTKE